MILRGFENRGSEGGEGLSNVEIEEKVRRVAMATKDGEEGQNLG